MRVLAVLAEALAVVGRHEQERRRRRTPLVDPAQQAPELGVDEGDLAVVGRRGSDHCLGGCLVGRVRVEVVHPEEEGGVASLGRAQPGECRVRGPVGGPLHVRSAARVLATGQVVVVAVEAAVEAEAALEREPGDEGSRPVAGLMEVLRQRTHGPRQHVGPVVADTVGRAV